MKASNLYAILLALTYALLFWLGNNDHDTVSRWYEEAAPWLGEPPAGLTCETERAETIAEFPCTRFDISPNEELKQKIISTFRLWESSPGVYSSMGIYPQYPEGKEEILRTSSAIYPRLELQTNGSMRFWPNDANTQLSPSTATPISIPYPNYLRDTDSEMLRSLLLAILCNMLPGVFCCVGWLWIQRKPIRSRETAVICLAVPTAVAFIGAFADFYIHGFHKNYAIVGAIFSVVTNLICAGLLIGITSILKSLIRKIQG